MKKNQPVFCSLTLLLASLLLVGQVNAQSSLDKSDQAILMFDFDLVELKKNELIKAIGIENLLTEADMLPPGDEFDVNLITRVYGAAQLPQNMRAAMAMGGSDDLPFEFFVRIEFSNPKGVESILDEIKNDSQVTEKDGKTYYQPPQGQGPGNLYVFAANEKSLEFGTRTYVFHDNRDVVTDSVARLWKAMPQHAIRICGDVEAARELVDELVQQAGEDEPEAAEFFTVVDDLANLSFAFDPNQSTMLSLTAGATDAEKLDSLRSNIEGLLFIARMGGKQWIKNSPLGDGDAGKLFAELFDQLKARKSGQQIEIKIKKPDGFDRIIKDVVISEFKKAAAKTEKLNQFRMVAIAIHNFADAHKKMPFNPPARFHEDLSWRARILPFMENMDVYEQMNMEQPWDSDTNKPWAEKMPKSLGENGKTTTVCWIKSDVTRFETILDGSSNTLMLIENPAGVPWSKNSDMTPEEVVKLVTGLKDGESLVAVFYDASTEMLTNKTDEIMLKAMLTPAGGEIIRWDSEGRRVIERESSRAKKAEKRSAPDPDRSR